MRNQIPIRVAAILFLSALTGACLGLPIPSGGAMKSNRRSAPDYATVKDVPLPGEPLNWNSTEFEDFSAAVQTLLRGRDFEGLDKMSAGLRAGKERFSKGGGWKINSFYKVTSTPVNGAAWEDHMGLLEDWKNATGSIAARISLSQAYIAWAWQARGSGYAHEVERESIPVIERRLGKARAELEAAGSLEERCHGYFETLLELGTIDAVGPREFERRFEEALEYEPTYQYFYTTKAERLLPRWSGGDGSELVDFAESLTESLGEREGSIMYFLVVSQLYKYKHDDFFADTRLSWRKTKLGFRMHETKYGPSPYFVNQIAQMAWTAKDLQGACSSHKRLTGPRDFDPAVWTSREAFLERENFVFKYMCRFPQADNQAL